MPGMEVRIDDGLSVPRGTVGELLVRGPSFTVGYWKGAGRIEDPKIEGWFATRDLMRQSEESEMWFVARK